MKNILTNPYILFAARCILAFIFIFSGIEKIANPAGFSESIMNYKLIPEASINILGIILPWIELTSGLLLLFGICVKENAFIISALLVVFILAVGISMARDLNISCGCFGTSGGTKVGFTKLGENILLLGLGALLVSYNSTFLSLSRSEQS